MSDSQHPHADRSVRVAIPTDARAIAEIQQAVWHHGYTSLLPDDATQGFDVGAATATWQAAIESPPTRKHRVFVALERADVVGFAASAPGSDADLHAEHDAELVALHVAPDYVRRGHGSRLMAAVADYALDDKFARLVCWVFAADDPMRMFLRSCGWDSDGSIRDLDVGELVHQVRLHTFLDADQHQPA